MKCDYTFPLEDGRQGSTPATSYRYSYFLESKLCIVLKHSIGIELCKLVHVFYKCYLAGKESFNWLTHTHIKCKYLRSWK